MFDIIRKLQEDKSITKSEFDDVKNNITLSNNVMKSLYSYKNTDFYKEVDKFVFDFVQKQTQANFFQMLIELAKIGRGYAYLDNYNEYFQNILLLNNFTERQALDIIKAELSYIILNPVYEYNKDFLGYVYRNYCFYGKNPYGDFIATMELVFRELKINFEINTNEFELFSTCEYVENLINNIKKSKQKVLMEKDIKQMFLELYNAEIKKETLLKILKTNPNRLEKSLLIHCLNYIFKSLQKECNLKNIDYLFIIYDNIDYIYKIAQNNNFNVLVDFVLKQLQKKYEENIKEKINNFFIKIGA